MNKKSGIKTLLMSVIMSSPGPLIIGLGLLVGQSTTQIADFVRRSIELLAIILSFVIYCATTKDDNIDVKKKEKLEFGTNIFVSFAMVLGGILMIIISLFSNNSDKGNVIPGLAIAILGVVANLIFWIKYSKIGKKENNSILIIQSKLYRAKTFVDGSVTIALLVVLLSNNLIVSYYFDLIGTCVVSLYLIYTGIASFINVIKN